MYYELSDTSVSFFFDNPRREKPAVTRLNLHDTAIPVKELESVLRSVARVAQGKRFHTQRNIIAHFLKPFIAYFRQTNSAWPVLTNEWQIFWLCFFRFYLTDTEWSNASSNTRMSYWSTLVGRVSDFFIADEIYPSDVIVPVIELKRLRLLTTSQMLLGENAPRPSSLKNIPQKLIVNVDFQMVDADYLDKIETSCRQKIRLIQNVCQTHWSRLMRDGQTGKEIASEISDAEIIDIIKSGKYTKVIRGGSVSPLASIAQPKGYIWALAVVRYLLANGDNNECISIKSLRKNDFFVSKTFASKSYKELNDFTTLDIQQIAMYESYYIFSRFAGLLSPLDVTVACCLLTIEHPSFTSESLQDAKLLNSAGKSYLLITDREQASILSVDKPRAGKRKSVVLTPLSQKLIADIINWTAPVRAVLKTIGDKSWRNLFLGVHGGGVLGGIASETRLMARSERCISLTRLYPELAEQGLVIGTFDFRRIRNTVGVLRWFDTGSVREMSRRLGNSSRVIVDHYLPPALLHAWNSRIIRRFQNTLIVLAACSEDYLADVSDFSTIADLQSFIVQLITDYPAGTSAIANEVHLRLRDVIHGADNQSSLVPSGVLSLRLSVTSLSYLYAFSDFAQQFLTAEALTHQDSLLRLSPLQFVELAQMLRHACENSELREDLSELLDMSQLRSIHEQALKILPNLNTRFSQFSLCQNWGEYEHTRIHDR